MSLALSILTLGYVKVKGKFHHRGVRLRFLVQVPTDLFIVTVLFGQLSSARIANRLASLSRSLSLLSSRTRLY